MYMYITYSMSMYWNIPRPLVKNMYRYVIYEYLIIHIWLHENASRYRTNLLKHKTSPLLIHNPLWICNISLEVLLMVQKSGDHQLRLVVEIPLYLGRVLAPSKQVVGLGISSTSSRCNSWQPIYNDRRDSPYRSLWKWTFGVPIFFGDTDSQPSLELGDWLPGVFLKKCWKVRWNWAKIIQKN